MVFDPIIQFFCLIVSFAGLYYGAEWLVRGASELARTLRIREIIIGLTIVAFGTSAPELAVNLASVSNGRPSIALGNIIGSNIANIGLILGITALIRPMVIPKGFWRGEYLFILITSTLLFWFAVNEPHGNGGVITQLEGGVLFAGILAFLSYCYFNSRNELAGDAEKDEHGSSVLGRVGYVVAGTLLLVGASALLVDASTEIARIFGVSEFIISLTMVAFGTSVPELATCLLAAIKENGDISLGNVVGSNIFNVCVCIGTTSMLMPVTIENVHRTNVMLCVMLGFTLILIPLTAFTKKLGKAGGAILLLGYLSYTIWLYVSPPSGAVTESNIPVPAASARE